MASMQDGLNFTAPPVGKVLLLGCIAAASAFVVTILIVVLCVGCQRKGKTHNVSSEGSKHRLMDMGILRQSSKLRSISKSDTEMNKMNCNGKSRQLPHIPSGAGEDGEHTYSEVGRRSSSAAGAGASRCTTDPPDALYAMVGRAGQTDTPAPPAVPANTPAPPDPDGEGAEGGAEPEVSPSAPQPPPPQAETTSKAEYACVRKLRKADKAPQKRDSGTDMGDSAPPPAPPTRHAPPSHPAPPPPHHPHSTKLPRRNMEAYNLPTFPKEAVFMGNGEQYIWKPPEDEDLVLLQNKGLVPLMGPHPMESIQPSAAMVAEMYSKVCKAGKKKQRSSAGGGGGGGGGPPPPPPLLPPGGPGLGSPPGAINLQGFRTLGRPGDHRGDHRGVHERDVGGFSVVVKPQTWANPQDGGGGGGRPLDEHCYESIGTSVMGGVGVMGGDDSFGGFGGLGLCDPAYENVDAGPWKRERPPNSCATLRPRRKKSQQPLQQQQPPPPPPCTTMAAMAAAAGQQQLQLLAKPLQLLPGDNLYESIGDLKAGQHSSTSSTTTIFTFNDGMEMYVTGL